MAHKVTLIEDADEVLGHSFKKGATVSVSSSIYTELKAQGKIKDKSVPDKSE